MSPDVQARSPLAIFNKAAVERNATRSTKTDASTQTEELPGATYGTSFLNDGAFNSFILLDLRSSRRYSPYVRYSPYRKLSRAFTLGSSGSGDLESARPTITPCASCGLPSRMDNILLDCSVQATIISECELEARPAVRLNLREPEADDQEKEENDQEKEEDDREKEMTFPGAYPVEQAVYALNEPAKLPARHFIKSAQKNHSETEVPTVHRSAQYGFKDIFFKILTYFFNGKPYLF